MSGEFYWDFGKVRFLGAGTFADLLGADDEVLSKTIDVLNKYMASWYTRYLRDQTIAEQYEMGLAPAGIAEGMGVSPSTVYHALRRFGVELRPRQRGPKEDGKDGEYLAKYNELRSYAAVGEHFGVTRQRAHQRIQRALKNKEDA